MDEFSQKLHEMFLATEKEYVVNYLRGRNKRVSHSSTVPLFLFLCPIFLQTVGLTNPKIGKFQQAAPTGISDLNHTSVSAVAKSGK